MSSRLPLLTGGVHAAFGRLPFVSSPAGRWPDQLIVDVAVRFDCPVHALGRGRVSGLPVLLGREFERGDRMTTQSGSGSPPGASGMPQQAREQVTKVGHEAAQAGGQVAGQAAGQGKQVATETGRQARNLVGEASEQLRQQAGAQQKRAADGLRSLGAELQSMASRSEDGVASEMVRRASGTAEQAAGWLEGREPGELVNEVRDYARRHPGTFLASAVVAGLLVGRLTRNVAAAGQEEGGQGDGHRPDQGARPTGMPSKAQPHLRPALGEATGPGSEVTR